MLHIMPDENKQQNKLEGMSNHNSIFDVSDVTLFKDKPESAYVYKKTEKLVSALYLLTSFISDKEPLKWQIRESGLNLLTLSLNLSDRTTSRQMSVYFDFTSSALKLLSFLQISHISGIVSDMNFNILKYEFERLIQIIENEQKGNGANGSIFPSQFFEVKEPSQTSKGQNIMSDRFTPQVTDMSLKRVKETVNFGDVKQKDKTYRQDIIISLLKKGGGLGIKDFTSAIKDVSEKTIQRELAVLVFKGQIKKEGEKRWSKYSLK